LLISKKYITFAQELIKISKNILIMEENKNKILLVIDAQYDFINGSLAVNGAEEKMSRLADFINKNGSKYKMIILTADWHTVDHMSFIVNGGPWPTHCVQHTVGAAIYQPIIEASFNNTSTIVLTKGDINTVEEYSIMDNYYSSKKMLYHLDKDDVKQVDVCGIANEYCVLETVKSLNEKFKLGDKLNILSEFVAQISEDKLSAYAKEKNIRIV